MLEFRIVHDFEADPQLFWRVLLDDKFQTEMYAEAGVKRVERRREDLGDRQVVSAVCGASWKLPAPLRALLGGTPLGYVETLTFHKQRGQGEVEHQIELPPIAARRLRFAGKITLERLSEFRVRRSYTGSVQVDLPLVGSKVEQSTVAAMQRSHESAAQLLRVWLARRAA